MLPQAKIVEVEKLLAGGKLSQRKIAALTGVSRGVVSQVALGTRRGYEVRRETLDDEELLPQGPIERCLKCGARVYMPCRLCHLRHLQEQATLGRYRRRAKQKAARRLLASVLRREEVQQAIEAESQVKPQEAPRA